VTVAAKKGAILAALAPTVPVAIKTEPFSLVRKRSLERPGAVKGAPLLGAAKRTLDGEDRSGTMRKERKARRSIGEMCGQRSGPFAHCHQQCDPGLTCAFHQAAMELQTAVVRVLSRWSLAQLVEKPAPSGRRRGQMPCVILGGALAGLAQIAIHGD
jgi:hypothetical protein